MRNAEFGRPLPIGASNEEMESEDILDIDDLKIKFERLKPLSSAKSQTIESNLEQLQNYFNDATKEKEFEKLYKDLDGLLDAFGKEKQREDNQIKREEEAAKKELPGIILEIRAKLALLPSAEAKAMYAPLLLRLNDIRDQNLPSAALEYADRILSLLDLENNSLTIDQGRVILKPRPKYYKNEERLIKKTEEQTAITSENHALTIDKDSGVLKFRAKSHKNEKPNIPDLDPDTVFDKKALIPSEQEMPATNDNIDSPSAQDTAQSPNSETYVDWSVGLDEDREEPQKKAVA
jgi:hypothetical protein